MSQLYVLNLSYDQEIAAWPLATGWGSSYKTCDALEFVSNKANIPDGAVILVKAHGNATEVGNEGDNLSFTAQIVAEGLIKNMQGDSIPGHIFIAACNSTGHALFAAAVRNHLNTIGLWKKVPIFGNPYSPDTSEPLPAYNGKNITTWQQV